MTDLNRRGLLAASAALAATPALGQGQQSLTKPIPHSGERLPCVGTGTAQIYDFENDPAQFAERKAALQALAASGPGRVIDTAPQYGRAEARLGDLFADTGLRPRFFLATKVNAGRTREQKIQQFENSKRLMRTDKFELMQLHNLSDPNEDWGLLREWKQGGAVKYIGMTTTFDGAYEPFEQVIAREKPDFIQVDYAIDNRNVETRVLPAAQAAGCAVLTALPFGRERLFQRTANVPLPDFAKEIGVASWAQFFLKFLISHPAVTCVIPGTDKPEYVVDNQGAARGPMPDAAMRARMAAFVDALPAAPAPAGRGGGGRGGRPGA